MKPKNHTHWLEKPNFHNRSVSDLRATNGTPKGQAPPTPPKRGEQPTLETVQICNNVKSSLFPPSGGGRGGLKKLIINN